MKRISTPVIFGVALIAIGALFLIDALVESVDIGAILRWTPSLFIAFGLLRMITRRFRGILGPGIMVIVAAVVQLNVLDVDWIFTFPAVLIAVGVLLLFGRRRLLRGGGGHSGSGGGESSAHQTKFEPVDEFEYGDDGGLRVTSVFGSSERRVSSDGFRGGEVVAVAGASKLDLRELGALSSPAALDVNCVMGEVALRVPPDWSVHINNTVFMGEAKDNRPRVIDTDADADAPAESAADLTITGAVVMGSLKIED